MEQFFQSYGDLIFFGVVLIAVFAMHGLGMGHGGHGQGSSSAKDPSAEQGKGNDEGVSQSCH